MSTWWPSWLPDISALPLPTFGLSLPSDLQRRFLSYVLRRALGRFLKPGQLDVQQIDSQIGSGYVQVKDVEVDHEVINGMLSGLPLRLRHGSVASVVARIPWPNPLTSNMGLFMNSLHLILEVTDAPMQERPANTPDSIVNLTESFMHEELNPQEAARLRYSAHYKPNLDPSSMTLDANIPGGFDAIASEESHADMSNETEESSIFSALVERLLSRFTFLANDTVIVIEKAGVARFTLKIPKVRYGDETDDDAEVKDTSNASDSRERSRLPVSDSRTLTITGVNISTCSLRPSSEWTSEPPSPADITQLEPTAFDTHAAVSLAEPIAFMATECEDGLQREHSYASDSDIDEDAAPMMSQSLFFHPRRSSPSPSTASSMYESAISETDQNRWRSADMTGSNVSSRIQLENVATGSSSTQRAPYHMNQEAADSPFMTDQPAVERAGDLIFSLGAEPIRILLEKTAGTTRSGTAPAVSSQGPPDQAEVYSEQIITAGRRTSRVTISIGTVALALQASHIRDIIELGDSVTAGGDSIATRPKGRPPTSAATTSAEISVHVRGIVVLLLPRSSDSASYRSPSLGAYFDHPLVPPCLQGAYTRAFIDDISGSFLMRDGDMPASSACVKVADLSVFSFHDTSSPAAYALPILITDCHLPSQYSSQHVHASAPLPGGIPPILELPSFDVADWTNPDQRSESAKLTTWRARASPPTHPRSGVAGLGLSTSPPTAINGIDILSHIQRGLTPSAVVFSTEAQTVKSAQTMASPRSMNVKIVPLHFFLDLGTLEDRTTSGSRDSDLLTFLEECTRRDAIQSAPSLPPSASPKSVSGPVRHSVELQTTPRVRVTDLPVENQGGGGGNMLRRQMIQDLELGFDYLQDVPTPRLVDPPKPNDRHSDDGTSYCVTLSMIRVQLRCSSAEGYESRSGAVVLDAHNLELTSGHPTMHELGDLPSSASTTAWHLHWTRMLISHAPSGFRRASGVIMTGTVPASLESAGHDSPTASPHASVSERAMIVGRQSRTQTSSVKTAITVMLPALQVVLAKPAVNGLQFWTDDVSQLMARLQATDPSQLAATSSSRGPSMIGSRFFARYGSRNGSVSSTPSADTSRSETVMRLEIKQACARLLLPRFTSENASRPLDVYISGIDALIEMNPEGKEETHVTTKIAELQVHDSADTGGYLAHPLLISSSKPGTSLKSAVDVRFKSRTISETTAKESSLKATLFNLLCNLRPDFQWVNDLGAFFKSPPGTFETVVPSERTKISVQVDDSSIRLLGTMKPVSAVLQVAEFSLFTDLVDESSNSTIVAVLPQATLLLIDDHLAELDGTTSASVQPHEHVDGVSRWTNNGFAKFAEIQSLHATAAVATNDDGGNTRVNIEKGALQIHICADTVGALAGLISELSPSPAMPDDEMHVPNRRAEPTRLSEDSQSRRGVMDAIAEEHDFREVVPDVGPVPDMVDDDLPSNPEYIDDSYGTAGGFRALDDLDFEEEEFAVTEPVAREDSENLTVLAGGETIRLLVSGPLHTEEHHFDTLSPEVSDLYVPLGKTELRVRVQEFDLAVFLYDGYDWWATRKTIEDETRALRRRLAKIRQMLASGQHFDPSVEDTSALLYNSVYVGLEDDIEGMDRDALIAVIDEELEDDFEATSQSSWQTLVPTTSTQIGNTKRTKRKRLTRSRNPSIEFRLIGLSIAFDQYKSEEPFASRTLVTVRDLQILDHIKTSTWKMFLTEMRADLRGLVRETGSDMVRIEIRNVRPVPGHPTQEARLRAKILPLRLHVDQDALDFMKKFFSFQDPIVQPPAETMTNVDETYFQHVEIFPIDIKLDYKPRRVDYRALRDGKTIELMNFFHFDGSEMTLRHIRLHGITGWARLGDMLNDLWTPDVKATQLVDVISGVAPIRSVVNVGSGVADLVLLPIAQYKKDGRIVRGLQKGAKAFMKSTGMEALKLGARLATGTQVILEQAEDLLGAQFKEAVTAEALHIEPFAVPRGDADAEDPEEEHDLYSRYAEQPLDAKQGIQSAYTSLKRNMNTAAQTILAVPMEVYERSGHEGPVRAVVRAVPIAVLKPMIGASEAVSKTLLGIHNTFDSDAREQAEAKYKQKA